MSRISRLVILFLLPSGLISLAFSIIYASSILAFIGLGLTFWGALILYVTDEKYVKQVLVESTMASLLTELDQMLAELEYRGRAVYLPPKYFKDFETCKIYIPKNVNTSMPTPKEIQEQEGKIFLDNSEAALITPPGFSLSKLFEKTLGTTFPRVDLEFLRQNLPKLFVEDLEIAENLKIETNGTIHVIIKSSIIQEINKESSKPSSCGKIGSPAVSAIACALTKATGKPITIENVQTDEDEKIIEATYLVLEPQEQTQETSEEAAELVGMRQQFFLEVTNLFLIGFGSTILAWVSVITWNDMTMWGKDLFLIFFGSRAGEALSLGIGMKLIYYFLIGLFLLIFGLIASIRKRLFTK